VFESWIFEAQYGFPPAREVVSGNAGNDASLVRQ
jgi:hypothetical protein